MDFASRLKVIEAERHDDSNQYYPSEVLGFVNAKSKAFCSVCKLLFDSVPSHISSIFLSGEKSSHHLVISVETLINERHCRARYFCHYQSLLVRLPTDSRRRFSRSPQIHTQLQHGALLIHHWLISFFISPLWIVMCCGAAYAVLIFYSQLAPTTSSAFR